MTAKFPLFALVFFVFIGLGYGQCPTDLLQGQNLVTNPDFSDGYNGWTHDPQYSNYGGGFSVPGNIYAGSSADYFNPGGFDDYNDHSPSSDNMYLMVDGICTAGVVLWSQNNIPISPNTNYYFGVWISSLKNQTDVGLLEFKVNGTSLGTTVTAPTTGGVWQFFEATWYSGLTPPATATITIANLTTVGCATQVDFAIDDISFIPGCSYGSSGPQPNLGPDVTVCGVPGGQVTLNAGLPGGFPSATTTINWSTGANGTGVSAPTSVMVGPGTYSVCVTDNGSCVKSDVIVVLDTYSIELGSNVDLCSNGAVTLNPGYTAASVTYDWTLDGNPAPGDNTTSTYLANTPGTYAVTVTPAGCAAQTDNVTISTSAAVANNATYCLETSMSVSVTGSSTYNWYTASTGGTLLQSNSTSYTATGLTAPNNYVYYVEDAASFTGSLGPTTALSNLNDWGTNTGNQIQLRINITQDLSITSLSIPYRTYGATATGTVTIEVRDQNGNSFSPAKTFTSTPTNIANNSGGSSLMTFNFTNFDIQEAWGNDLRLTFAGQGGGINGSPLWNQGGSPAYPYNSGSGIITIVGSGGANATNNDYAYFYNIAFQTGSPCARVPVQVLYDCPPCMTATEPTSVSADNISFCIGSVSQITLSAVGGSGPTLAWYSGSCGGTPVGTGNNLSISSPSVPTTYYARYEDGTTCQSNCKSVVVTPVQTPTTPIAGSNQNICNVTSASISANVPTVGTGAWSVLSGTGTIGNTASASTTVSGIGAGDLVLQWTISNAPCAALNAQLTIHRDVLTAPSITFANSENDTCANTTGLNFQTSVLNASNTYTWTSNGTVLVTSQTSNTAVVLNGASGGKLFVTETSGSCQIKDSVLLTITPDIAAPNAGADQAVCTNSISLNATGTGTWSTTGSAIIANASSATTSVSNLGAGINTFTWTVTGCGGPLNDDVEITLGTSGLVLTASAELDTLCVNTARTVEASVSGGSGNYQFVWSSSDNSISKNTSADNIEVSPSKNLVTYYVLANDLSNSGCSSNLDSVTFVSVSDQELVIPNLITPNGDNKNETFYLSDEKTNLQLLPGSSIEITNRWGDRIYTSSNYDNSWNADKVTDGIFYYYLQTGCGERKYKGWLQVIR